MQDQLVRAGNKQTSPKHIILLLLGFLAVALLIWQLLPSNNDVESRPTETATGFSSSQKEKTKDLLLTTVNAVIQMRGDVRKESREGVISPITLGSELVEGERLHTGENSSITLRFSDQSMVIVSEKSSVSFENLLGSKEGEKGATILKLLDGRIESRVSKQGFGAKYEVRTPAMQLAVRGTIFEVDVDNETKQSRAVVLEGSVEVSKNKAQADLNAGFGVLAHRNNSTLEPTAILQAPKVESLNSPLTQLPLILDWQVLSGADQYQVQVFTGDMDEVLVFDENVRGNLASISGLANGNYLVRVRGVDTDGLGGFYGNARFVLDAHPIPPIVLKPIRGISSSQGKVDFLWQASKEAKSYLLQVSDRPDFSHMISQVKHLPAAIEGLSIKISPGHYYWRIASISEDSEQGPFSPVQVFTVLSEVESTKNNVTSTTNQ